MFDFLQSLGSSSPDAATNAYQPDKSQEQQRFDDLHRQVQALQVIIDALCAVYAADALPLHEDKIVRDRYKISDLERQRAQINNEINLRKTGQWR